MTGSPSPVPTSLIPAWALQMDSSRRAHHLSNAQISLSKAPAKASSVRVLPSLCRLGAGGENARVYTCPTKRRRYSSVLAVSARDDRMDTWDESVK